MNNKQYALGAIVIVVIVVVLFWYSTRTASAPTVSQGNTEQSTTTTPAAATTTATSSKTGASASSPYTLSLAKGDTVASWNFQGAYTGNADLTQKAQVEVARLSAMLGSGKYPNYELYIGIANQYDLMGDGAKELTYLEKALGIDSVHTGLAWENLGGLMARLGANFTARTAFENAVNAQPFPQYIQTLLSFLQTQFPQDSADIQKAQHLLQTGQGTTTSQ